MAYEIANPLNFWYNQGMAEKKKLMTAPSVLAADFSHMAEEISLIERSGADWIHFDIMDGSFVPQITFGHKFVSDMRQLSSLPFDIHLMVNHPETMVDTFAEAGSDWIIFHVEATVHIHRLIQRIRLLGKKPGISLVPSTPVSAITPILSVVDQILVMSVNPGFGGQQMLDFSLDKIKELDQIRREKGYTYLISVDGGINRHTVESVRAAGADVVVAGSAFFGDKDPASVLKILRDGEELL